MYKALGVALLLWIAPAHIFSQQKEVDSLRESLAVATSDTARVVRMAALCKAFWYVSADSALHYGDKALKLSEKIAYPYGKALCYNNIGVVHDNAGDYKRSVEYYAWALAIWEKLGDEQGTVRTLNNLGGTYYLRADHAKALENYFKVVEISKRLQLEQQLSTTYNNIGLVYESLGNYVQAMDYYLLSVKLDEKRGDLSSMAFGLGNAGSLYKTIGDHEKALALLTQALKNEDIAGDMYGAAICKIHIAQIRFEEKKDTALVLPMLYDAIRVFELGRENVSIMNAYSEIGDIYRKVGEIEKAIFFHEKGLKMRALLQEDGYDALPLEMMGLAKDYQAAKKYGESNGYAATVFRSALKAGEKKAALDAAVIISQNHEALGDVKAALHFAREAQRLSDGLSLLENAAVFENLKSNYDNYKTTLENDALKRNEAVQSETIKRQKAQRLSLFMALGAIAIIALLLFLNNRRKQLANRRLEQQKQELKALNAVKDKILSIIAHDLRGPLTTIEGLMTVMEAEMLTREEQKTMIGRISATNTSTLETLDTLLRWARVQKDGEHTELTPVGILPLVLRTAELFSEDLAQKKLSIHYEILPGTRVMADENQLDFVLRNLIANALKFTPEGGSVTAKAMVSAPGKIDIVIADTGVGMTEEQMGRLFNPETHFTTRGLLGEKGTGLGLLLCKEFVENSLGTLSVKSKVGEGTEFIVTLRAV